MKIPTLLALIILSLLIIVGIWSRTYLLQFIPNQPNTIPQNLLLSNLTPNSVNFNWTTLIPSQTRFTFTTDKNFFQNLKSVGDDQDQLSQIHQLHYVTLTDLQPNTTYYYKIGDVSFFNSTQKFQTPSLISSNFNYPPLIGQVNNNSTPVAGALVILNFPGYFPLTTYTSKSGSFVLSLQAQYNQNDLTKTLDLSQNPNLVLIITKDHLVSKINLHLTNNTLTLPSINLGQNLDLTTQPITNRSTSIQPQPTP